MKYMSTFILKNTSQDYTPVSNIFIDQYMSKARGEYIKVYLMLLKYTVTGEPGINSTILASKLDLLESDVMNALNYWNNLGIIQLNKIDNMNNFNIEFLDLHDSHTPKDNKIDLLSALNSDNTKDMLKDIEGLLARPLSPSEMSTYLNWQREFGFSSELILLLMEYCISKGKSDPRYIEKVALSWHDSKIKNVEDAQNLIKKNEDKWVNIRSILKYLGINNTDIMKPQQDLIEKWLYTYNFPLEVIQKACSICFERLNRADFKYIDGILGKWKANNIKTLEDIELKDKKTTSNSYNNNQSNRTQYEKPPLRFNNFEPRDYDYNALEKKLLGWDNDD